MTSIQFVDNTAEHDRSLEKVPIHNIVATDIT